MIIKVLFLVSNFPNLNEKASGLFNLARALSLKKLGCEVKVLTPVGFTPSEKFVFPIPKIKKIIKYIRRQNFIPKFDRIEHFDVYYLKWGWLPRKYFWYSEVNLFHFFAGKRIYKVIKNYAPDVIITSWLHPYGTFAKYIKRKFDIPIISILEGSDILLYPYKFRGINKISADYLNHV
ncbi:unnamed protein product, partial [marine sediment metagenome]